MCRSYPGSRRVLLGEVMVALLCDVLHGWAFVFVIDGSRKSEAGGHRSGSDPYPGAMTGGSAATDPTDRITCPTDQTCDSGCTPRPLGQNGEHLNQGIARNALAHV